MISERHAAAARANGAKSRGPITARGKANASRNSLRHGLRAKTVFDDGKFEDERRAILTSFLRELQPQSEIERRLVEIMAASHWRQTRFPALETALLNDALRCQSLGPLELLGRFERRCVRQFSRALAGFLEIVAKRTEQITENKGTADAPPHPQREPRNAGQHSAAAARQRVVDRTIENALATCVQTTPVQTP